MSVFPPQSHLRTSRAGRVAISGRRKVCAQIEQYSQPLVAVIVSPASLKEQVPYFSLLHILAVNHRKVIFDVRDDTVTMLTIPSSKD